MAAIYMWHEEQVYYLSSTLYPIDSTEGLCPNTAFTSVRQFYWEDFEFDMGTEFLTGELLVVRRFGAFDIDDGGQLDSDTLFLTGELLTVRRFGAFEVYGGQLDPGTVFLDGTLQIVVNYIQFTAETESLEPGTVFLDAILTTV